MADAPKVVGIAALVTVGVGSANAVLKEKRPPSTRFLIGAGVAFVILSALAEFDSLDEIAKGLALGVMTTVILSGEAGGLLTYIDTGEFNTKQSGTPEQTQPTGRQRTAVVRTVHHPGTFAPAQNPNALIPGMAVPGPGRPVATF